MAVSAVFVSLLRKIEEPFSLLVIFLLLAYCYGSTPVAVTVQQGEMANLTFNCSIDISDIYHFLIERYDLNDKYRDTVLDCLWRDKKEPECQKQQQFSIDENVTSILHLKINQTSKNDTGIYKCKVVIQSNSEKEEVCRLSVTVQDAFTTTWAISEGLTEDASEITTNSSFTGNVGWEQSYEHAIPIILGVIVFLAILVTSLLYFIKRHPEEFQQCKCFHKENKKETDESLETKTELLCKDTKTETRVLWKVDNDINLQETKPESEEQHSSGENNRTETSASAATHMIVDERLDLGKNVNLRNKTCA